MKTIKKIKYLFILSCLPILFGIACGGSSESTTTTTTTTTTTAAPTSTPAPTPAPTTEPNILSLDELTKIIANEIQSAVIAGTMEKLDPKDLCSRATGKTFDSLACSGISEGYVPASEEANQFNPGS